MDRSQSNVFGCRAGLNLEFFWRKTQGFCSRTSEFLIENNQITSLLKPTSRVVEIFETLFTEILCVRKNLRPFNLFSVKKASNAASGMMDSSEQPYARICIGHTSFAAFWLTKVGSVGVLGVEDWLGLKKNDTFHDLNCSHQGWLENMFFQIK